MEPNRFSEELLALEPSLQRYALSLTGNVDNAADLVQDTFLKALTFKDSYAENTNMKAWAFTIMRNTFINHYRRLSRKNTMFDDTEGQSILVNRTDETAADSHLEFSELEKAIGSLTDEFRVPFTMHTHGYKYREIADELNLRIGTVKSRIFFSRQKLVQQLPGYSEARL